MLASRSRACGSTGRFAMGGLQTLSAGNMGQLGAPGTGVPADECNTGPRHAGPDAQAHHRRRHERGRDPPLSSLHGRPLP